MNKIKHFVEAVIMFLLLFGATGFGQNGNQAALDSLLSHAEMTHSEAVIVYKNNKLLCERYFGVGKPEKKIETMSATKSIVGLAVACMLSDGLLDSLDVPVSAFFPEWRQGQKQLITVRHLLTHTSGLQNVPNTAVEIYPSPDFVKLALAAELSSKPGTMFNYNNKALNLMAGVIQQITHKRMDRYIGERLFKPLGIVDFSWSLDSAGNPHTMSGCQLRPSDFIKIGLVLLNNGRFNGTQVISEKAVKQVVQPSQLFGGYGLLWWIDREHMISIIDDSIIREMETAHVDPDFIEKIKSIKGIYQTDEDFSSALTKTFGSGLRERIGAALGGKNVKLRNIRFDGSTIYRADGYLGNYIIVIPDKKLAAVRMISDESYTGEPDGFANFRKLVGELK